MEVVTADLGLGLAALGHEITVVTSRDDDDLAEEEMFGPVAVRRLDLATGVLERDFEQLAATRRALRGLVDDTRPDLVHVIFSPLLAFHALRLRIEVPTVAAFHGMWSHLEGIEGDLARRLIGQAQWTTACSEHVLERLRTIVPSSTSSSSCIPNGRDGDAIRAPAGAPAGTLFAAAGRFSAEKGFDLLLEAFAEVRQELGGARLRLLGDGQERAWLEELSDRLGVSDAVEFTGWVAPDRIPDMLGDATAVVVPSRSEGFGMIALEAALCGRPVIATSAGGLPEVVGGPDTGVLVEPGDVPALAAAMRSIAAEPARAAALGEAARERALRLFPADRPIAAHDRLYRRVLGLV